MIKSQTKYSQFPVLPETQIIDTFNNLKINTADVLRKPTCSNVKEIYQQISSKLLDCHFQDFIVEKQSRTSYFMHPEMHEQSMLFRCFSLIFPKILEIAGIEDFDEFDDIGNPSKKRVLIILSGLLNLLKFANALRDFSADCKNETSAAEKSYLSAKAECEELKEERAAILKEHKEDLTHLNEFEQSIEKSQGEIKRLRSEVALLNKEETVAKKNYQSSKEKMSYSKSVLQEKTENFASLREQIVSSPDKIKTVLNDMKEKICTLKQKNQKREKQLKECKKYDRIANKLSKKINSRAMDCEKIAESLEIVKGHKKRIKTVTAQIEGVDQEISNLEESREALVGSQEIQKKRNGELQAEIEEQRQGLISAWDKVSDKEALAHQSRAKETERAEKVHSQILEIERRLNEGKVAEERLLGEAEEEMKRFSAWWEDFDQKIDSPFGNVEARESRWKSGIFEEKHLSVN